MNETSFWIWFVALLAAGTASRNDVKGASFALWWLIGAFVYAQFYYNK